MPSTLLGQISCHEDFGLLLKRNFPTIPSFLVEQKTRLFHGKAKIIQQGNLLGFIPPWSSWASLCLIILTLAWLPETWPSWSSLCTRSSWSQGLRATMQFKYQPFSRGSRLLLVYYIRPGGSPQYSKELSKFRWQFRQSKWLDFTHFSTKCCFFFSLYWCESAYF